MAEADTHRWPAAVWAIAVLTGALHFALAGRYDFFRNELYFIVCGRHPDFGYVDQPPLIPLLAAATQAFGENLWLLRLPAAVAAAALPLVTAGFARLLGGKDLSVILAAAAVALSPGLAEATATLTTSTFEPLAWTLCAYFLAHAIIRGERAAILWAGITAGIAMEAKYGIAMWLIGLSVGVLATPARRILRWRECWIGIVLAALLAAPSLLWQALHGWPFFSAVFQPAVAGKAYLGSPARFLSGQIIGMNPLLFPLWMGGLVAPFAGKRFESVRFAAIAALAAASIDYAGGGKDYYLFPVYPTLISIGAVALGEIGTRVAAASLTAALAAFAAMAPVALPLFEPDRLARYLDSTGLRPWPNEWAAAGAPLTQVFSDEMGWRDLARKVSSAYGSLTDEERSRTAIIASNYGEAAAIDIYGAADRLPRVLSGENQYFLWGIHDFSGDMVIDIGGNPERWRKICQSVDILAMFGVPYAMPYEKDRPIFLCRGLRASLATIWPRFKRL